MSTNVCAALGGLAIVGLSALAGWRVAHTAPPAVPITAAALGSPQLCQAYRGLPPGFTTQDRAGMVTIPAGRFQPGTRHGYPDERPTGTVDVAAFWIDQTEVTNAQFAVFVATTGYQTQAEQEGGAAVFKQPPPGSDQPWWGYVDGASWQHPDGPGSNLQGRAGHPVIHITRQDALAYAHWLGRDLPTESEWEWAARAGGEPERLSRQPRAADGRPVANFWQGVFPSVNTGEDGHVSRAPVGCYPANGWGVYDMIGNVWEWTLDPYVGLRQLPPGQGTDTGSGSGPDNTGEPPDAPSRAHLPALAPDAPYVIKGGSFLCSADYCSRYRSTARHPLEANLPTSHVGFRTVWRPTPKS